MSLLPGVSLLLAWAIGLLTVNVGWPALRRSRADLALVSFLGLPFGLAVTSIFFLGCSLVFARPLLPSLALEIVLGAGLFAASRLRRPPAVSSVPAEPAFGGPPWLAALLLQMAVVAAVVCLRAAEAEPYGSWDGWAIWNLHARFIFLGGPEWPHLLQAPPVAWTHPDYPFLVPASVARAWAWAGRDAPAASAWVSAAFGISALGVLVSALRRIKGPGPALLAGIVLLGTPFFVTFSSNQHADIPLGAFVLASCALTLLDLGFLAGMAAGFAAATKNEGVLFAAVMAIAWAFRPGRGRFLLGLGVAAAPLIAFKARWPAPNDLMSGPLVSRLGGLFSWPRHRLVLSALRRDGFAFGEWRWAPILPLVVAWLLPGRPPLGPAGRTVAGALLLTLAGYYAVYLITPHDLQWQLDTSLVRLLLQLWPAALLLFGLALPDESLPPSRRSRGAVWVGANALGASAILLALSRQWAPGEVAMIHHGWTRISVQSGPGWFPAESRGKDRWLWSGGEATLRIVADSPGAVHLAGELRSLAPMNVVVRQGKRQVWKGTVDTRLRRVDFGQVSLAPGVTAVDFSADQPGVPESPGGRTLAFALYNLTAR